MTIDALIMLSGALVALVPFLGFPVSWDKVLFFLLGLFVIALGIVVRRQRVKGAQKAHQQHLTFTESAPQRDATHENGQ